jgi:hypothetical protein
MELQNKTAHYMTGDRDLFIGQVAQLPRMLPKIFPPKAAAPVAVKQMGRPTNLGRY